MIRRTHLSGVIALALGISLSQAQEAPDVCKPGEGITQTEFDNALTAGDTTAVNAILNHALDSPAAAPNAKQISALGGSTASPDIVSSSDFPSLFAMAVDTGFISQSSGATTLNLNFFAFIAAVQPRVVQEQEQYQRFTNLRRLSGSITLGGVGDAIDQNGDGVVDDPKTADNATDIVTWELRYRVYGSRDRRDRRNYMRLTEALKGADDTLVARLTAQRRAYIALHPEQRLAKFLCRPDVTAFIANPANRATIDEIAKSDAAMRNQFTEITNSIDTSLLVTLVAGGTERRKDIFGPDKRLYGLRTSWAKTDMTVEANLDFNQIKSFRGAPAQDSTKFGLAYNGTCLRDLVGHKNQGVKFTIAAAFEKNRNVPTAAYDQIETANLKITYPISDTISLPFSITWANHTDLLMGEKDIRGNIGFTYDLSPLFSPQK